MNAELNMDQYIAPKNGFAMISATPYMKLYLKNVKATLKGEMTGVAVNLNAMNRHAEGRAASSGRSKLRQPPRDARLKRPMRSIMVVARYVRRPDRAPAQSVTNQ